ncbi:hypothetical protein V9T40_002886 [Parthenolecanium corni]|uniref:Uncharacterized protein n=1 Tax=Parthenolecanium corni TaxID=536013 RepID=A0AAN9Y618_9HEMI
MPSKATTFAHTAFSGRLQRLMPLSFVRNGHPIGQQRMDSEGEHWTRILHTRTSAHRHWPRFWGHTKADFANRVGPLSNYHDMAANNYTEDTRKNLAENCDANKMEERLAGIGHEVRLKKETR